MNAVAGGPPPFGAAPPPPAVPPPAPVVPSVWPPARQALVALGVAVGMLTAAGVAAVGADAWSTAAALVFAMTVVWVAADPRAVAAEVAAGTLACTVVLIGADGTAVAVVPLVTGVVAAVELAAAAGRVGMVVRRDPVPDLRRAGVAAAIAVVTSGATLAASALPGPDGLAATLIGGAGLALAALAIRRGGRGHP